MISSNAIDVALYTKDENLAYKFRTKYNSSFLDIKYLSDFGNLALYLLSGQGGIVVFDLRCVQFLNLLSAFSHFRNNGEFIFIYLTDNFEEVEINDFNSFVCSFDDVGELVNKLSLRFFDASNYKNEEKEKYYTRIILKILEEYKISPKHKGFDYLKDSISLALKYKQKDLYLNTTIYPQVAKIHNTTTKNVEKSIRLAINRAAILFPEVYNDDVFKDSKVTSSKFVSYVINKIENLTLKDFI